MQSTMETAMKTICDMHGWPEQYDFSFLEDYDLWGVVLFLFVDYMT